MKKQSIGVLLLLMAAPLMAQEPPRDPRRYLPSAFGFLDRLEADAREKSAALRRDSFVVAQLSAAAGELNDFQKHVALQKATDHVEAAAQRAAQRPPSPQRIQQILASTKERLKKAREQGFSADSAALQRDIVKGSIEVQSIVFRELQEVRKSRQILTDVQSRVSRMTEELDQATGEALASALEVARVTGD